MVVSGDTNVIKEETKKAVKYMDLTLEIQRMWNAKTKVMPVIIEATRTILKSFRKYLKATYRDSMKSKNYKNSHIGHCTHTAESASVKVQNIFHVLNNITCSINCKYRTAATLYTLETWVVSSI